VIFFLHLKITLLMRESNDKSRKSENAMGFLFGNVAQLFRDSYGPYGHFDQVGPSQVVNDSTVNSETLIENVSLQPYMSLVITVGVLYIFRHKNGNSFLDSLRSLIVNYLCVNLQVYSLISSIMWPETAGHFVKMCLATFTCCTSHPMKIHITAIEVTMSKSFPTSSLYIKLVDEQRIDPFASLLYLTLK